MDLRKLQALPLEVKVRKTILLIKEWYRFYDGDVYIAFSGGKDSTVLTYLVRSIYPDVPVVFCDTGLEFPEIREFVLGFDNLIILKPRYSFLQVIQKYGYPVVSKEQSQFIYEYRTTNSEKLKEIRLYGNDYGRGKISKKWLYLVDEDIPISHKCCEVMKKNPSKKFEKETGLKPYIGTMASESALRESEWKRHGCNAFDINRPVSKPLSFWNDSDIWEFIRLNDVPYSRIYDMGYQRTGCMFCMYGAHNDDDKRFELMSQTHPKLYDYCMNFMGLKHVREVIQKSS